jgi:hypothetical protein
MPDRKQPEKRRVGVRFLTARYDDCSIRSIDRWVEIGRLPPPLPRMSERERRMWWLHEVEACERRAMTGRSARK